MKVRKSDLMLIFFWILCLESITSIIKNNILSNIVQFILLFIIAYICISQRKKINLNICGIWKTYCMLIALMILPDIINLNIKSGFRYIMPFVFRLVTMLFIFSYFYKERITEKGIVLIPVLAGVFFSIGGIIIKIGRKSWLPGFSTLDARLHITKMGYLFHIPLGEFIDVWEGNQVERMCSFFTEPTNYALFLEIPLFFSYALLWEHKKIRNLICACIVSIGFIMTESRAGFVSVLAAIVVAILFRPKKGESSDENLSGIKKDICKMLIALLAIFILGIGLLKVMYALADFFPQATFLQAGIFDENGNVSLIRPETTNFGLMFQKLLEQPWGYGISLIITRNQNIININYANAINAWAIGGGILGILIVLCMLAHIALKYAIPCLKNKNKIVKTLGMIFFSMTIHQISDGDWMRLDYIMIITIMVMYQKQVLQLDYDK